MPPTADRKYKERAHKCRNGTDGLKGTLAAIQRMDTPKIRRESTELYQHVLTWFEASGLHPSDAIRVNWAVADMMHETLFDAWERLKKGQVAA